VVMDQFWNGRNYVCSWRSELAELESKGTMIEIEYFANERTYTKLVINPLAKVVAQLESIFASFISSLELHRHRQKQNR